jgi:prepilin-type processing-associated H-X9-DG protein
MSEVQTQPRWSRAAVASLVLGLLSPLLQAITGVPALLLGYCGLYAINASDGRLQGRRCAAVGIILGSLGTLLTILWGIWLLIGNAQQASLRTQCTDNLRRIGLALLMYGDNHRGTFPPGTAQGTQLLPEQRVSWQGLLLPALETRRGGGSRWQHVASELDLTKAWDDPANAGAVGREIVTYRCPADPRATLPPLNLTSYIGMAGVGLDAAAYALEDPRAGFFGYDRTLTVSFKLNQGQLQDDLPAGLSHTITVAETLQDLGPWAAGGPSTVRGLDPDEQSYFGPGRPYGGLHPKGVNLLWADASVRFQSDAFPAHLFREQVRIHRQP